jgi:hypothetical protein
MSSAWWESKVAWHADCDSTVTVVFLSTGD